MLFFLKLIRLVFSLIAKVVLFPFKLVLRLVRGGQSSDVSVDSDDLLDVGPEQAATHASRFRRGLLVLGGFQLVIVLVAATGISSQVPAAGQTALLGGIAVIVAIAVITLLLGYALAYRPTVAWYGAMGLVGIQLLGSLFAGPSGVLGLVIFGLLGYWGYTGRSALGAVYGSSDVGSTTDSSAATATAPSTEPTADAPTTAAEPAEPEPTDATVDGTAATAAGEGAVDSSGGQPRTADSGPAADPGSETVADPTPEPADGGADPGDTSSARSGADETETIPDEPEPTTAEEPTQTDAPAGESQSAEDVDADPVGPYRDDLTAADADTRATAVRDLADEATDEVPPQAVVDALTERLDDENPAVRAAACEELGRLGVSDARPQLEDRRIDSDPEVSRAASRALRNID